MNTNFLRHNYLNLIIFFLPIIFFTNCARVAHQQQISRKNITLMTLDVELKENISNEIFYYIVFGKCLRYVCSYYPQAEFQGTKKGEGWDFYLMYNSGNTYYWQKEGNNINLRPTQIKVGEKFLISQKIIDYKKLHFEIIIYMDPVDLNMVIDNELTEEGRVSLNIITSSKRIEETTDMDDNPVKDCFYQKNQDVELKSGTNLYGYDYNTQLNVNPLYADIKNWQLSITQTEVNY